MHTLDVLSALVFFQFNQQVFLDFWFTLLRTKKREREKGNGAEGDASLLTRLFGTVESYIQVGETFTWRMKIFNCKEKVTNWGFSYSTLLKLVPMTRFRL